MSYNQYLNGNYERQYVGARYVPLLMGDWEPGRPYERLSVVSYLRDNYTSRKDVPVGILPTDKEYWMKTSDYNGAMEDLSRRVTALENYNVLKTFVITDVPEIYNYLYQAWSSGAQPLFKPIKIQAGSLDGDEWYKAYQNLADSGETLKEIILIGGGNENLMWDFDTNGIGGLSAVKVPVKYFFIDDIWHDYEMRQYKTTFARKLSYESNTNFESYNFTGYIRNGAKYKFNNGSSVGYPGPVYYREMWQYIKPSIYNGYTTTSSSEFLADPKCEVYREEHIVIFNNIAIPQINTTASANQWSIVADGYDMPFWNPIEDEFSFYARFTYNYNGYLGLFRVLNSDIYLYPQIDISQENNMSILIPNLVMPIHNI